MSQPLQSRHIDRNTDACRPRFSQYLNPENELLAVREHEEVAAGLTRRFPKLTNHEGFG